MTGDQKIKKYSEFKVTPGLRKNLNHLQVKGVTKGGFLVRENEFKVDIFYSPIRSTIIEIEGLPKGFDIPFQVGEPISKAIEWVRTNKYEITLDIKRI